MVRLTEVEKRERAMLEADLQALIIDPENGLAPALGWETFHVRPGRTRKGWRTPTEGSLAAGWPDLVLVRARDRRLIFAELKRQLEDLRPEQYEAMTILAALAGVFTTGPDEAGRRMPGIRIDTHVWRPSDLRDPLEHSLIYRVLL